MSDSRVADYVESLDRLLTTISGFAIFAGVRLLSRHPDVVALTHAMNEITAASSRAAELAHELLREAAGAAQHAGSKGPGGFEPPTDGL